MPSNNIHMLPTYAYITSVLKDWWFRDVLKGTERSNCGPEGPVCSGY
jgi:hypothetical protein